MSRWQQILASLGLAPNPRASRRRPRRTLSIEPLENRYALSGLAGSAFSVINGSTYALPGVSISVVGRDAQNNVIASVSTKTDGNGLYSFTGLPAGNYTITETHPDALTNGSGVVGSLGGTAGADSISNIVLGSDVNGTGYNFREGGVAVVSVNLFLSSTPSTAQVLVNAVAQSGTAAPTVAFNSVIDPITSLNAGSLGVSGTGKAGATVSVVIVGGSTTTAARTATVAPNGTWTVSNINANPLPNGSVTYRATITDSSGATATSTRIATKSAATPLVDITSATTPITLANQDSVSVSGTAQPGSTLSIVVTDGTTTTPARSAIPSSNGSWSVDDIDASGLKDGSITYRVTMTDSENRTFTDTFAATKATVVITSATNPVTSSNQTSTIVSGTGQVGATISLTVTDGTTTTSPRTTSVGTNGTWTIENVNVSALKDGAITYTATADDGAGNTDTSTRTANKAAVVLLTTVTNPINPANQANTSASGTGKAGASVSVTASDGTTTTTAATTTVDTDGAWSVSGIDVTGLQNGTITYTATANDGAGNTGTSTLTSTKSIPAAPVANNDTYNLAIGATLTTTTANGVLANDTSAVSATLISGPAHGSMTLNPDGTFSYTQTTYGFDQFVYEVTNGNGQTAQATVTIRVPNLPPLPEGAVLTTTASGLQYYDFVVGTGASPSATDTVTVDYVGYLPNGNIFDSNNNINFALSNLIAGFSEGVQGMKEGGMRRLIIPPNLGYGPGGNPSAGIGGTDTIIFDVTLDAIVQ